MNPTATSDPTEARAGDAVAAARAATLAHALAHVPFDGWSDRTLAAAVEDAGVDPALARLAFPRGGVDLALAWHDGKDAELAARLAAEDLRGLRFRDRIAHAIALRLEIVADDRDAVRRATALFALPTHAADGARALWRTADTIWTALGDTSTDASWYTKRATLSAVWSSCLLYWLGDRTPGAAATREFIHRRIDNVMAFEEFKARVRRNPLAAKLLDAPSRVLDRIRGADHTRRPDLPGRLRRD
ncbi:COQ9 family protein [Amaricoccus sp.]|uniref:COQ9 family protein n=1 Tax=Amaricoccus sp. TaxID=1872485 RepID=UPI001B702B7E|nr:COQ9 family protein [Amaricoccus sp.]MBP7243038.1 COQ9 family protein [Amaricoccus sp.]